MTQTRDEISINDLTAVMEAAKLLRKYGLISVAKIREIRTAVNEDAAVNIERHTGCDEAQRIANDAWKATRPL